MGTTLNLAEDESFVEGRSQETAERLVKLAKAAGLKGSVKTTYDGYIVPTSILEDSSEEQPEEQPEEQEQDENPDGKEFDPTEATVAEVKDYLANADEAERARVITAEQASDNPRKGITDLATTEEAK